MRKHARLAYQDAESEQGKRPAPGAVQSVHAVEAAMMLDWNAYKAQILAGVEELGKASVGTVRGYRELSEAGSKTAALDAKTRELIALAVAVTRQCDGCITIHTEAAITHGATKGEVVEALGVAIAVNAGAALVYSTRVLDAYNAKTSAGG
jgi:AhpD family alkylhydroperoxidase